MKSKVFDGFLASLTICMLSHTLLACSEKVASGGTVDDNTIAENDIKEHHVDSTKVFAEAEPSGVGNHKIDSAAYWYEIHVLVLLYQCLSGRIWSSISNKRTKCGRVWTYFLFNVRW